jgi:hypothetical protein
LTGFASSSAEFHEDARPISKKKAPEVIAEKTLKLPLTLKRISTLETEMEARNWNCKTRPRDLLKQANRKNLWWNSYGIQGCTEAKVACPQKSSSPCNPFALVDEKSVDADLKVTVNESFYIKFQISFTSPFSGNLVKLDSIGRNLYSLKTNVSLEQFSFSEEVIVDKVVVVDEDTLTTEKDKKYTFLVLKTKFNAYVEKPKTLSAAERLNVDINENTHEVLISEKYQNAELKVYEDLTETVEKAELTKKLLEELVGIGSVQELILDKLDKIEDAIEDYNDIYKEYSSLKKSKDPLLSADHASKRNKSIFGNVLCGKDKWQDYLLSIANKRIIILKNEMMSSADIAKYESDPAKATNALELFEKFKVWQSKVSDEIKALPFRYGKESEVDSITGRSCSLSLEEPIVEQTIGEFFDWNISVFEARYRVESLKEIAGQSKNENDPPWLN